MKIQYLALFITVGILLTLLKIKNNYPEQRNLTFDDYKMIYNMEFDSQFENKYRQRVFLDNFERIQYHNALSGQTYKMGVNQFTHLTQQQFVQFLKGKFPSVKYTSQIQEENISVGDVNWVTAGAIGPVKNQGSMGNAVIYTAIGNLESVWKIKKGSLPTLSITQLNKCTSSSSQFNVLYEYAKNTGLYSSQQYDSNPAIGCSSTGPYKFFTHGRVYGCYNMGNTLYNQPISVYVDASNWSSYASGIFSNCGTNVNHAVLVVGKTTNYWLIQNTWGTTWGEAGYIRLSASGNTCGMCDHGQYPIAM